MSPVAPLRLSWRIIHIINATSGSTKTAQKISDGVFIIQRIIDSSQLIFTNLVNKIFQRLLTINVCCETIKASAPTV
jgi:hypothetical protein